MAHSRGLSLAALLLTLLPLLHLTAGKQVLESLVESGDYAIPPHKYIDPKTGKEPIFKRTWVITKEKINGDCLLERPSAVANGQLPGPTVRVREGTRLLITIVNKQDEPVTIHWHGIDQRESQWHDGVAAVTQCDILQGQSFTYNFSTESHSGTLWWHSHVVANRNTIMGALIVLPRQWNILGKVRARPPVPLGNRDIPIIISDWYELSSAELVEGQMGYPYQGWPPPDTLMVNGRTRLSCQKMWEFTVQPKKWYRLRVINGALYATLNFIIQHHAIFTYESEGGYLKPKRFSSYDIMSGQSYQFLMFTNQKPGAYWVGARARWDVEGYGGIPGLGIMRYVNTPPKKLPVGRGVYVGPTIFRNPWFTWGQILKTKGAGKPPSWIKKPTKFVMLQMNMHNVKNKKGQIVTRYSWNNATLALPYTYSPLEQEFENTPQSKKKLGIGFTSRVPPKGFAKVTQQPQSRVGFGVLDIEYGSVVHMVFQGHVPPGLMHPIHVHGTNFYVVGSGFGTFDPAKWKNGYNYNLKNPVDRNTAFLLEGGWVAIRFIADNPGIWLMHCHLEPHVEGGMAAVFRIHKDGGIPPPPKDYPKCTGAGH